ncbi:hypothetical protein DERP_004879 [Dermatophagoides pteronyssinus]|uniref:Uncharacterized protein n=1 Tax=Dermatophagoides pteronyssinus TaxID=6956 RepID=A0ABQ8JSS7_DERPT|nr:hypothetical protein DERP_004879 [Dermatophagoides pteronyssinus]
MLLCGGRQSLTPDCMFGSISGMLSSSCGMSVGCSSGEAVPLFSTGSTSVSGTDCGVGSESIWLVFAIDMAIDDEGAIEYPFTRSIRK